MLNTVMPNAGFDPFATQGEAPDFEFSPGCRLLGQWWVLWGECVLAPLPLSVVFLLVCSESSSNSASLWVVLRGIFHMYF